MLLVKGICSTEVPHTVADADLQIRGGPVIISGGGLQKDFFFALQASVSSKNKGGPEPPGHLP